MSVQEQTIESGMKNNRVMKRIVRVFEAIRNFGDLRVLVSGARLLAESFKATEGKTMALRGTWQSDPAR